MDEEEEHQRHRAVVMPPLVNRTFELPVTRPKGPSVLQQLRDRDPKATSSTPLIVSHSSGLSLAYIEASVYSELLPAEGVTLLSISGGGGALLPPPDDILGLPPVRRKAPAQEATRGGAAPDYFELVGRSAVGIAAVWRGIVARIFSVSPATDLRELLLVNAGDVTFKVCARACERESERERERERARARAREQERRERECVCVCVCACVRACVRARAGTETPRVAQQEHGVCTCAHVCSCVYIHCLCACGHTRKTKSHARARVRMPHTHTHTHTQHFARTEPESAACKLGRASSIRKAEILKSQSVGKISALKKKSSVCSNYLR